MKNFLVLIILLLMVAISVRGSTRLSTTDNMANNEQQTIVAGETTSNPMMIQVATTKESPPVINQHMSYFCTGDGEINTTAQMTNIVPVIKWRKQQNSNKDNSGKMIYNGPIQVLKLPLLNSNFFNLNLATRTIPASRSYYYWQNVIKESKVALVSSSISLRMP